MRFSNTKQNIMHNMYTQLKAVTLNIPTLRKCFRVCSSLKANLNYAGSWFSSMFAVLLLYERHFFCMILVIFCKLILSYFEVLSHVSRCFIFTKNPYFLWCLGRFFCCENWVNYLLLNLLILILYCAIIL